MWVCQDYSCRGNHNLGIPHIWINAVYTEALCEYRFPILCESESSKVLIVELPLSDKLNSHSWSFKVTPRSWTLLWSCCHVFCSSAGKAYVSAGKLKLWSGSGGLAYFLIPVDFRFVLSPEKQGFQCCCFEFCFWSSDKEGCRSVFVVFQYFWNCFSYLFSWIVLFLCYLPEVITY